MCRSLYLRSLLTEIYIPKKHVAEQYNTNRMEPVTNITKQIKQYKLWPPVSALELASAIFINSYEGEDYHLTYLLPPSSNQTPHRKHNHRIHPKHRYNRSLTTLDACNTASLQSTHQSSPYHPRHYHNK